MYANQEINAKKQRGAPKLLWANSYCLMDTSSGASIDAREMLIQLSAHGWEIKIVGATIFDSKNGIFRLKEVWRNIEENYEKIINFKDGSLTHQLVVTKSIYRSDMLMSEEEKWYSLYISNLESFKPDIVFYYGGKPIDLLIADEARQRGIRTAAYLANASYVGGTRWCRDVDLIITNSHATADLYLTKTGLQTTPVGVFINPKSVIALEKNPQKILFVNPSLAKGVGIVILLALELEKRRPEIKFEVVESRGNWNYLVRKITKILGDPREQLNNVVVTPNTDDMRGPYSRARILLAPSLWWEAFGRVAAEAMLNGIPAIVTNRGGLPEVVGDGGIKVNFPADCYEEPYTNIPKPELVTPLVSLIERFYDDEDFYQSRAQLAANAGRRHDIEFSTSRLIGAFSLLLS